MRPRTATATASATWGVMPLYHTVGVRSLLTMALVDGRFVCTVLLRGHGRLAGDRDERVSHFTGCPRCTTTRACPPRFPANGHPVGAQSSVFAGAPSRTMRCCCACSRLSSQSFSSTTTAAARFTPSRSTRTRWANRLGGTGGHQHPPAARGSLTRRARKTLPHRWRKAIVARPAQRRGLPRVPQPPGRQRAQPARRLVPHG